MVILELETKNGFFVKVDFDRIIDFDEMEDDSLFYILVERSNKLFQKLFGYKKIYLSNESKDLFLDYVYTENLVHNHFKEKGINNI